MTITQMYDIANSVCDTICTEVWDGRCRDFVVNQEYTLIDDFKKSITPIVNEHLDHNFLEVSEVEKPYLIEMAAHIWLYEFFNLG